MNQKKQKHMEAKVSDLIQNLERLFLVIIERKLVMLWFVENGINTTHFITASGDSIQAIGKRGKFELKQLFI